MSVWTWASVCLVWCRASWQNLFCHGHGLYRRRWGSWRIQAECLWVVESTLMRGCWTVVGKESKKGGSPEMFEDCKVGLDWRVGGCIGVGHFDGLIIGKFWLLVALPGGIGGRPSRTREWFVVRIAVGLDHIWLNGYCRWWRCSVGDR